jgi:hypothetical protein
MNSLSSPITKRLLQDGGIDQCELMGATGLILQAILGGVVILVLVCNHLCSAVTTFDSPLDKRIREKPRRHWKIWMLDVSKQIVSALTAHFLNVLLAQVLNDNTTTDKTDACGWFSYSRTPHRQRSIGISSQLCSIRRSVS